MKLCYGKSYREIRNNTDATEPLNTRPLMTANESLPPDIGYCICMATCYKRVY
jgi:hypothetical protein